jgi:hypothetical protein
MKSGIKIYAFLISSFFLSWALDFLFFGSQNQIRDSAFLFAVRMWIPAFMALLISWIADNYDDFRGRFFSFPEDYKAFRVAYLVPLLGALFLNLFLVLIRVNDFAVDRFYIHREGTWILFAVERFITLPIVQVALLTLGCLGEEVAWRGFLWPQLKKFGFPNPLWISGFIWSLWYFPLVLFAGYQSSAIPFFSLFFFTVTRISQSLIFGKLLQHYRSFWPAALWQAVHLVFWFGWFDAFVSAGEFNQYLNGGSGFLGALFYVGVAAYFTSPKFREKSDPWLRKVFGKFWKPPTVATAPGIDR